MNQTILGKDYFVEDGFLFCRPPRLSSYSIETEISVIPQSMFQAISHKNLINVIQGEIFHSHILLH